jgi:spore germination protein KA
MEITFEALREAGVRLPKAIGQAVSIVGALVIGQAAVQAGIISAPMVIIVSITGIASFTIPRFNFAIALRMLRFPIILLSGALGIFGLVLGILAILIHVCGLRSFGVPYLMPIAPFHFSGMKDTFIRVPRWAMMRRPEQTSKQNRYRQTSYGTPKARMPKENNNE